MAEGLSEQWGMRERERGRERERERWELEVMGGIDGNSGKRDEK